MGLHNISSILLDISIGLLLLCSLIRLILALTYYKRNGKKKLTDAQRDKLRKIITPVASVSLLAVLVSIVLMFV